MWHQMSLLVVACCLLGQHAVHSTYYRGQRQQRTYQTCTEKYQEALERIEDGMQDVEFPDCDDFGNYQPKQCYARWTGNPYCYCANKITGEKLTDNKVNDKRIPWGHSMTCQCAADNPRKVDFDKDCESATGDYKPVSCIGDECFCVHRTGGKMENYEAFKRGESNCLCARAADDIVGIGVYYDCYKNGGYKPVQCTGSHCYCVTAEGKRVNKDEYVQIGSEEHRNLQC